MDDYSLPKKSNVWVVSGLRVCLVFLQKYETFQVSGCSN